MENVLRWSCEPIWEWNRSTFDHPDGSYVPLAVKLNFEATNNMAEYKTCIAGMEVLRELGVKEAKVFGDSTLVIAQA